MSPRSQYQGAGNPFNQTNASLGHISSQTNTANVKGKITAIEVTESLNFAGDDKGDSGGPCLQQVGGVGPSPREIVPRVITDTADTRRPQDTIERALQSRRGH